MHGVLVFKQWREETCRLFPYTTLFRSRMRDEGQNASPAVFLRRRLLPGAAADGGRRRFGQPEARSEEHTSELQSRRDLVCRPLLEKKKALAIPKTGRTSSVRREVGSEK